MRDSTTESISTNLDKSQQSIDIYEKDPHFKFCIDPVELENLMQLYKERGETFPDIKYFEKSGGIENLLKQLHTDKINGIKSIHKREEHFGSNKVFAEPPATFMSFACEALEDTMVRILILASIIEIFISMYNILVVGDKSNLDWLDGISIIGTVCIVVLVDASTNYNNDLKFRELNEYQNNETKYPVIRNGILQYLINEDLLVGDLLLINYGDILPADMLLIEGNGIKVDESSLTGESHPVKKEVFEKCLEETNKGNRHPPSNLLLSGTDVIEGKGKAIVIAIGDHSQKGIIRRTVDNSKEDSKTPLQLKLDDIAEMIGWFGLSAAFLSLIPLLIHLFIEYQETKEHSPMSIAEISQKILRILILCVSIIVAAVPEGLPLAVTLSLAFSINKLMDLKNLVRKLSACETMGGATYICTDKTGTLTTNEMQVYNVVTNNKVINLKHTVEIEEKTGANNEDEDYAKQSKHDSDEVQKLIREDHGEIFSNDTYWDLLKCSIALNVDCSVKKLDEPNLHGDMEEAETKNKTDKAFIDFLYRYRTSVGDEIQTYFLEEDSVKVLPFDSQRKRMTTFVKNSNFPSGYRLFTKGGAENVKNFCTEYIDKGTGEKKLLTEKDKEFINQSIEEMNREMLRSLYVCYKDITEEEYESYMETDENGLMVDQKNLTYLAIFGLRDQLRNGVKEAVLKCQEASVKVIMVTGDNIITATSIAKECNILSNLDLKNISKNDMELEPWKTNNPETKAEHIEELLTTQPKSITGNSFFATIEGLYCQTCGKDSNACRCPKTEAEAEEISKKKGGEPLPIKKDAIKNIQNFKTIIKNLRVMARSQPLHKYALVVGLKQLDHVVAVTGDGTNDAPALSKSDVGFAMFSGTDIAKEASDIVILDNNFSSLTVAIIYGRNIFLGVRKFIQFQLVISFGLGTLIFVCACIGTETPITSIQILWINLIMDSFASLALATEQPYKELITHKPNRRSEKIINGKMWKHIVIQALFSICMIMGVITYAHTFVVEDKPEILTAHRELLKCFGELPGKLHEESINFILEGSPDHWNNQAFITEEIFTSYETRQMCIKYLDPVNPMKSNLASAYYRFYNIFGNTTQTTMIFNIFVLYYVFNMFNCRVIDDSLNIFKRISNSKMFWFVLFIELFIQMAFIQMGGRALHVVVGGLSMYQWIICVCLALLTIPVDAIIKFIPVDKLVQGYLDKAEHEEEIEEMKEREKENLKGLEKEKGLNDEELRDVENEEETNLLGNNKQNYYP